MNLCDIKGMSINIRKRKTLRIEFFDKPVLGVRKKILTFFSFHIADVRSLYFRFNIRCSNCDFVIY